MIKKYISFFSILLLSFSLLSAQTLKPGFDKKEYRELMRISAATAATDTNMAKEISLPHDFKMIYQSEIIGMDNLWDLWVDNQGRAAISIRGTTRNIESWLANFYASMVPAKGEIEYKKDAFFTYNLASHPEAGVHVGWLLSTAYLSEDIIPKIVEQYQNNINDFFIIGHSQGGGIAYLLTSHLMSLQKSGVLPKDIQFKTYCSAAPKPGNLFYAYEFESQTQEGWAYNVVNAADWVPEVPITIQTLNDFNKVNPFVDAKSNIKTKRITQKLMLNHVYHQLDRPTKKALRKYHKYLGEMVFTAVQEHLQGIDEPIYFDSYNYVRTGNFIVLNPDEKYYEQFPKETDDAFTHHSYQSYLYLLEKL